MIGIPSFCFQDNPLNTIPFYETLEILTAKAMLMKMNIFSAVQSPLAQPMVQDCRRRWQVIVSGGHTMQCVSTVSWSSRALDYIPWSAVGAAGACSRSRLVRHWLTECASEAGARPGGAPGAARRRRSHSALHCESSLYSSQFYDIAFLKNRSTQGWDIIYYVGK